MNNTSMGMIVGGLVPAILFGIAAILQKASNKSGIGLSYYLLFVGLGVIFASLISFYFFSDKAINIKAVSFAFLQGVFFSGGILFLAIGLTKYSMPISQLSPLISTNGLITTVLGLIIFSEFSSVNVSKLILGSIIIVMGVIIVGKS